MCSVGYVSILICDEMLVFCMVGWVLVAVDFWFWFSLFPATWFYF